MEDPYVRTLLQTVDATGFDYSGEFAQTIIRLHRGKEGWPNYQSYIKAHLGGPESRLINFIKYLCPEIMYHCGSLKQKRTLDFGCGTGATTAALAYFCDRLCGFDIDMESVSICRRRIEEHRFQDRVDLFQDKDLDTVRRDMGTFDLILLNGVIEHIPLSKRGLRRSILRALFGMLNPGGHMFITDTPNRLCPYDYHSTQLWWIPWARPGSQWGYQRAVSKGRHSDAPTISSGTLGLEEVGAWGATFWEIRRYLAGEGAVFLNTVSGHDRHIHYVSGGPWKRRAFELLMYYPTVRILGAPITAFAPYISNLIIQKRRDPNAMDELAISSLTASSGGRLI